MQLQKHENVDLTVQTCSLKLLMLLLLPLPLLLPLSPLTTGEKMKEELITQFDGSGAAQRHGQRESAQACRLPLLATPRQPGPQLNLHLLNA